MIITQDSILSTARLGADTGLTSVDFFAGAGGLSDACRSVGVRPIFCANHDGLAVATHHLNHPQADHACANARLVSPDWVPRADILVAGPECIAHSQARGHQDDSPESLRSRCSAWELYRFASAMRPLGMVVENVVQFCQWSLFETWVKEMEGLGYTADVLSANAMHCGVPQSRDRIFVIFVRSPLVLPEIQMRPIGHCPACDSEVETYQNWKTTKGMAGRRFKTGSYRRQYIYSCSRCGTEVVPYTVPAATVIDWTIAAPPIAARVRPLRPATMRRLQAGIETFWLAPLRAARADGLDALLIETCYSHDSWRSAMPASRPLPTQSARQSLRVAVPPQPFVLQMYGSCVGERSAKGVLQPSGAITAQGNHHLLSIPGALLTAHYSAGSQNGVMREGIGGWTRGVDQVAGTITAKDHHTISELPRGFAVRYNRTGRDVPVETEPVGAMTSHDRYALAVRTADTDRIDVGSTGFRLFTPRECGAFQDFGADHLLPQGISQRDTVRLYGNGVPKRLGAVPVAAVVEAITAAG